MNKISLIQYANSLKPRLNNKEKPDNTIRRSIEKAIGALCKKQFVG